ncbi:MAG: polyphosphate kinase [Saprospiraceae bacterium]|nr:polyphosphate kinase [Saprospiraceae bacterium]
MIKLSEISTVAPEDLSKKPTIKKRDKLTRKLGELQHLLYAEDKRSILVVFQGMDASGKDGATRKVFRYCSPSGVWAYGFKKPSDEEFDHDFLWRVHKLVPRKGHIQIFNRSHYEDVLIQRVHHWIDETQVAKRMEAINSFEKLLEFDNRTKVVKFYMHVSRERQKEKLQERIDDPSKNWKHNAADWEEAKLWDEYRKAYEDAINGSSIPWVIVPSDQRWYRDYFVARHLVKVMQEFDMKLPVLSEEQKHVEDQS